MMDPTAGALFTSHSVHLPKKQHPKGKTQISAFDLKYHWVSCLSYLVHFLSYVTHGYFMKRVFCSYFIQTCICVFHVHVVQGVF